MIDALNKGQCLLTLQKALRTLQMDNTSKIKLGRHYYVLFLTNRRSFQRKPFKTRLEPYKMFSAFHATLFVL